MIKTRVVAIVTRIVREGELVLHNMAKFRDPEKLDYYWDKIKDKYSNEKGVSFYTVNCSKASPPPSEFDFTKTWCPYCKDGRTFTYNEELEVNQCNVCGISTQDFYVRKYNNLGDR